MPPRGTNQVATTVPLVPTDENAARPRLSKLIIKNFRTIGTNPVVIDLDDIVVLVGANNTGKSSILRAYEVAMSTGSTSGRLAIDDFPNGVVDNGALPEVEIHTIISDNRPGQQWIQTLENGEMLIRERWTWPNPGVEPKRQGYNAAEGTWSEQVPWGAPNVANAYRPKPHRIEAFSSPDKQAEAITKLISDIIKEKFRTITSEGNNTGRTDYELLIEQIRAFQTAVSSATQTDIEEVELYLSEYLSKIFPNHVVKLDIKTEEGLENSYSPFKESPVMLIGPTEGFMSTISTQGSGARRTLLWTALKYISEHGQATNERPHVLLLDEPELCLHPSAIRDARDVLYDLPQAGNWQVMVTTHSPIFIDLSCDNTTIVRVDRAGNDEIKSTTLYRPRTAALTQDEKENLKILNICDPYLHEFFFGGRIIVVEGDTEYTAFSLIKMLYPAEYNDIHIIRARGKGIIPSVIKVLNQFTCDYAVLHDGDTPTIANGNANPAWALNNRIKDEISSNPQPERIRLIACKTNFETALFGAGVSRDKPYNTVLNIRGNEITKNLVKQLFDALLDITNEPPTNCIPWNTIEELQ